jgi:hypothetical protein
MYAAISAVGLGEIALLHCKAAQIVARHGPDLVQLADQEIGKRLLRLRRRLMGGLVALMRLVRWLVRTLMSGLVGRLMNGLRCRLYRRCLRRLGGAEPAMLKLKQFRQCGKFGLQVFEPRFMLGPDLLHELLELSFVSVDLLLKQVGTVLQVPSYVTHVLAPR